jgi:Flp pilus assembly protein TadD
VRGGAGVRSRLGPDSGRSESLCLAGALALVLSAYANSLFGPFLWDDLTLLESASRLPAGGAAAFRAFAQPFQDWWGCYYRPLTALSFLFSERLFGADPVAYHAVNLLGHLANVTLLFFLVRCEASSRVAALAAALWGVLPRLTESTTWISGRTDVFAATAVFAALLLWHDSLIRRCGAALCLLLGLLFKEVAVAAVPVLVLRELLRPSPGRRRGSAAARLVSVLVVLALYAAVRNHVLVAQFFRDGIRPLQRVRLAFESLGTYAVSTLDAFRPRLFIGDKYEPRPELAALGIAVLAGLIVLVLRAVRAGRTGVAEGLVLAGAALLPVLHLVPVPIRARAADRLLYIPLAGVAMAIAASSGTWSRTSRRVGAMAALVLAPALAFATAERNRIFGDEIDFWWEALRTAPPASAVPRLYFADLLERNGRILEAARLHQRLASDPRTASAVSPRLAFNDAVWLGISLGRAGRDDEAIRVLDRLAEQEPASPVLRTNLIHLYLRRQDIAAARTQAERLAELVGASRSQDAFALIEEVARKVAAPRDDAGRTAEERKRHARLLGRLGGPRARAAWLAETEAPDATEEALREATTWLLGEGSLEEASRAYERLRLRAPKGSETVRLGAALAERRERERKLDAAIAELRLSDGADPP